jgi:hypothetical protein
MMIMTSDAASGVLRKPLFKYHLHDMKRDAANRSGARDRQSYSSLPTSASSSARATR